MFRTGGVAIIASITLSLALFSSLRAVSVTKRIQSLETTVFADQSQPSYSILASAIEKPTPKDGSTHKILRVVDGDTVEIEAETGPLKVRVIGIDTPETVHPSKPVEPGGPEATERAKELLADQNIIIHFDPNPNHDIWDKYNRLLAYLELPDGRDFGLVMVQEGHAKVYTKYPFSRQEQYLTIASELTP
jgi:endonuclease YncB( thermonuclease family)